MRSVRRLLLLVAASMVLTAAPAAAHVTANPNQVPAEGYTATSLRIGHGCADSPTVEVAVQMPSGVLSATPEQIPGWTASTVIGELDEPYESHGETVTEGVTEVVWAADTGEELPADQYRDFGLSLRLSGEPGDTLYFPTVQTCSEGEHRWIEIPDTPDGWGELEEPAPYVTLATAHDAHGHEDDDATAGQVADEAPAAETAPDDPVAADPVAGDPVAADGAGDASSTSGLVWAALALGLVGAITGGAALAVGRRR